MLGLNNTSPGMAVRPSTNIRQDGVQACTHFGRDAGKKIFLNIVTFLCLKVSAASERFMRHQRP
jgi:hypothetical protein